MNRGSTKLVNDGRRDHASTSLNKAQVDTAMEELIRRAKLQAGELSLLIQRLERLRVEVRQHLNGTVGQ
jgi:hypothetical protein